MKTLLQQVQSRISKRRDMIRLREERIALHYDDNRKCGVSRVSPVELRQLKQAVKAGAESQKLDKQIFQMLLSQERNKHADHFRSAHKPWKELPVMSVSELCDRVTADIKRSLPGKPFIRVNQAITGENFNG